MTDNTHFFCSGCGAEINPRRAELGYDTCLDCGDAAASAYRATWTVALTSTKGHYTRVTNKADLLGINAKAADWEWE